MRYSFIILLLFIAAFTSCRQNVLRGSGAQATVNPAVSSFTGVHTELPLKLDINAQPGAPSAVQISGYENVLAHIKTKVEDNTLIIYTDLDEMWTIDGKGISVKITLPSLATLSLSGAPDAAVHGHVTGLACDVDLSGAGAVTFDSVNTDTFAIDASGAADLRINGGTVKYAEYDISGAGHVRAFPLQTAETIISISGAGSGQVTATQKLDAHISGAGSIKYKGHPVVSQEVSGAGSVKDAN